MPRIPFDSDALDDEQLVPSAEQARIARRDHDASAASRALMQTGAAKQLKAMTEARSYRGIPKVAKQRARRKCGHPRIEPGSLALPP